MHEGKGAGEQHAHEAEGGDEVEFLPHDEVVDRVGDGKHERDDEGPLRAEPRGLAAPVEDDGGQRDIAAEVDEEVFALRRRDRHRAIQRGSTECRKRKIELTQNSGQAGA